MKKIIFFSVADAAFLRKAVMLLVTLSLLSLDGYAQVESGDSAKGQVKTPAVPAFEGTFNYIIKISGRDAELFAEETPWSRMDMHMKEDNFIIHLHGGNRPKTFLFIGDSAHTFIVDAQREIYYLRDYYRDTSKYIPKAIPTGNKLSVYGISCLEYKVVKGTETQLYYVNDNYRVDLGKYATKEEAKADFLIPGLEGRIPLKKVIKIPNLTIDTYVTKIEKKPLDIENFQIPASFVRRIRDHRY